MDVTEAIGISKATPTYAMTTVAADFTGDGWTNIYVASDSAPSLLFVNQRNGMFKEEASESGVAFSEHGLEQAGMGVGVGDYALSGHLDIFKLTSQMTRMSCIESTEPACSQMSRSRRGSEWKHASSSRERVC